MSTFKPPKNAKIPEWVDVAQVTLSKPWTDGSYQVRNAGRLLGIVTSYEQSGWGHGRWVNLRIVRRQWRAFSTRTQRELDGFPTRGHAVLHLLRAENA